MKPEKQRIAIAKACGFKVTCIDSNSQTGKIIRVWAETPDAWKGKDVRPWLPDFLNDLNAMHEAEKTLFGRNDWSACSYERRLNEMTCSWHWHATAAQRAEAFIRTLNLWQD